MIENESRDKAKAMALDILALMIEVSSDKQVVEKTITEKFNKQFLDKVKSRIQRGLLPQMQIDGTIEFQSEYDNLQAPQ